MTLVKWIGAVGVVLATQACVIRETVPVNAGYYPASTVHGSVTVGEPTPYAVSALPPDPLFEQMTPSPGVGYVWIDGSWHWNGTEWVWVGGRWVQEQPDLLYVQPYYAYYENTYIYTPGYWCTRDRVPAGGIVCTVYGCGVDTEVTGRG